MIALQRPLLLIAAVCYLLTGAALLVGRLLPTPEYSVLARNPCALPCFYGVVPGVTTGAQGVHLHPSGPTAAPVDDSLLTAPLADADGRISIALMNLNADGRVETVRVSAAYWIVDIGHLSDALLAWGEPTRVYRTCTRVRPVSMLLSFGAEDSLFVELLPSERLTPETPVSVIWLMSAGARPLDNVRTSFGCSVEVAWRGFAPLWSYVTPDV